MFWAFAGGFSKGLLDSIETREEREAVKQQMELQTKLQERLEKLRSDLRLEGEEGARVVVPDTGETTVYNRKGNEMFRVTDPAVPLRTQMEKDKAQREATRDEALNEAARAQAAAARAQAGRTAAMTPVELEATRALAEQRRRTKEDEPDSLSVRDEMAVRKAVSELQETTSLSEIDRVAKAVSDDPSVQSRYAQWARSMRQRADATSDPAEKYRILQQLNDDLMSRGM